MTVSITAHMVVKNEDRFIWYAISSILPYVNKIIIFDTGSKDKTISIIRSFKNKKIIFRQKKSVGPKELSSFRQEQIELTKTSWIWIIDGDEVYPKKTAQKVIKIIAKGENLAGVIVHRYDLLGDIYHYQDEKVGAYNQFGKKGHYVLRLINKRKIKELQVMGDYPNEYFASRDGQSIKNMGKKYFAFIEEKIFHAMYLKRSTSGANLTKVLNRNKMKIELGKNIDKNELPEVFFMKHPSFVSDVTKKADLNYKIKASFVTPVKQIKRRFFSS